MAKGTVEHAWQGQADALISKLELVCVRKGIVRKIDALGKDQAAKPWPAIYIEKVIMDESKHYNAGRDIIIADNQASIKIVRDSFNVVAGSQANEEVKAGLKKLAAQMEELTSYLGKDDAQAAARHFETLSRVAASKTPDRDLVKTVGEKLIDAAKTCSKVVVPITQTVGALLKLFGVVL